MSDGVTRRRRAGGREVFLAQVRVRPEGAPRDGSEDIYESKQFDDYDQAKDWHDERTAQIKGDLRKGRRPTKAPKGSFGDAIRWAIDKLDARIEATRAAGHPVDGWTSNDKNLRSKLRWWLWTDKDYTVERTSVSVVALSMLDKFMLQAETDAALAAGDGSVQTQIHRINAISWLFEAWRVAHKIHEADLPTPTDGARMSAPGGRERRCRDAEAAGEDQDEEAALLAEARLSNSRWLAPAIIIAMDTAIRQEELVLLEWRKHVFLDGKKPHIHLTKDIVKGARGADGGKPRTIRLKKRTIESFRELKALNEEIVASWNAEHPARPKKVSDKPLPVAGARAIGHAWTKLIANARVKAVANGMTPEEAEARVFPDLHWHDLRHEGISRWFERTNENEMRLSTMAGHGSLETTRIYTHLRGADAELEPEEELPAAGAVADDPGTVKLTDDGAILVLTTKGEWVPLTEAKQLVRAHGEELVRAAYKALFGMSEERLEAGQENIEDI